MHGGSANDDAFVNWHLTTGLSVQVAGNTIFIPSLATRDSPCHNMLLLFLIKLLFCLSYIAFSLVDCEELV
jgi:hypothetical protein